MSRWLFALLILVQSGYLFASPQIAQKIQQVMRSDAVICGEFEQRKTLVGIRNPLVSKGRFCVLRGEQVLWKTEQPFASMLVVNRDSIVETIPGQVARSIDAQQEPSIRLVNDVLFALLGADFSQIEKLFSVQGKISKGVWQVDVISRDRRLAKVIKNVRLNGAKFVEQLHLQEAAGDGTQIQFKNMKAGSKKLLATELAAFE